MVIRITGNYSLPVLTLFSVCAWCNRTPGRRECWASLWPLEMTPGPRRSGRHKSKRLPGWCWEPNKGKWLKFCSFWTIFLVFRFLEFLSELFFLATRSSRQRPSVKWARSLWQSPDTSHSLLLSNRSFQLTMHINQELDAPNKPKRFARCIVHLEEFEVLNLKTR